MSWNEVKVSKACGWLFWFYFYWKDRAAVEILTLERHHQWTCLTVGRFVQSVGPQRLALAWFGSAVPLQVINHHEDSRAVLLYVSQALTPHKSEESFRTRSAEPDSLLYAWKVQRVCRTVGASFVSIKLH